MTYIGTDPIELKPPTKTDKAKKEYGICETCGSSGRVVVPHIGSIRDGQWNPYPVGRGTGSLTWATMAVFCYCALGRWMANETPADKRPWELERYQVANPTWRQQMRERHLAKLKEPNPPGSEEMQAAMTRLRDNIFAERMRRESEEE